MSREWSVENASVGLSLDEKTLGLTVRAGRETWRTGGSGADEIAVSSGGEVSAMPLAAAGAKNVSPWRSGTAVGFRADLAGFGRSDLALTLLVMLDLERPELSVRIAAGRGGGSFRHLRWPGPMASPDDRSAQSTALPIKQGVLLAGDWPDEFRLCHNINGGGAM